MLTALEQLSDTLTPAPIAAMSIADDLAENFRSWHTIAADPALTGRLDAWAQTGVARLVALESGWADAARGTALCHADLRADNLLLTADGVMVVDWPYAVTGAPWVDVLLFRAGARSGPGRGERAARRGGRGLPVPVDVAGPGESAQTTVRHNDHGQTVAVRSSRATFCP